MKPNRGLRVSGELWVVALEALGALLVDRARASTTAATPKVTKTRKPLLPGALWLQGWDLNRLSSIASSTGR